MADEIAAFDADAYWNSGECWQAEYYDSKEAFMEDWLLANDEEFRATMLEDWLDSQWWEYYWSTQITRTRAELGGVEGQIGVMLDGTYISFPDAVPEVANGRTMVPCRQVLEAFGGHRVPRGRHGGLPAGRHRPALPGRQQHSQHQRRRRHRAHPGNGCALLL